MALDKISIRKAVLHNIHKMNADELRAMVVDSIEQKEEKLLPGLGVVFETIWEHTDTDFQEKMIHTLHEHLPEHVDKPL